MSNTLLQSVGAALPNKQLERYHLVPVCILTLTPLCSRRPEYLRCLKRLDTYCRLSASYQGRVVVGVMVPLFLRKLLQPKKHELWGPESHQR